MTLPLKITAGIVGALVLVVLSMFVLQWGPFKKGPSAAAKEQPKVAAKVEKVGAAEGAAVGKAEDVAKTKVAATGKRTEENVAKIRAAARSAPPTDVPDRDFYVSVCQSQLYSGSADCDGYRGQPESPGPVARARGLRRR